MSNYNDIILYMDY